MSNPIWFYTNAAGDKAWETLTNWNSKADGTGINPTDAPWNDPSGMATYSNYDLVDATGGVGITCSSITLGSSGQAGKCYIPYVTFTVQSIYGGSWYGDNCTFSCWSVNNAFFYGNNCSFNARTVGNTIAGDNCSAGFVFQSNTVTGGSFTLNCTAPLCTFSGVNFIMNGNVDGSVIVAPAFTQSTSGGFTIISLAGSGGSPTGPYFKFPTPSSTGGGDILGAGLL